MCAKSRNDDGQNGKGFTMKIVVAGGSGFIGRHLCQTLVQEGHDVTVLSRDERAAQQRLGSNVAVVEWDGLTWGALDSVIEGTEALINLAGAPIADARWTDRRKQLLQSSRVDTTRLLVDALSRAVNKPQVLINASGIGFYGAQDSKSVDEESPEGRGFLADLCVAWEREAMRAEEFGIRVVRLRIGMVLEKNGGALPKMVLPFRLFLGGPIMPGTQPVSWIHIQDLVRLINWLMSHKSINGAVNAVAPHGVTMREFCQTLAHVLGRPSWLPVPEFALKLGLGELANLMTTGQAVEPRVATRERFTFKYPDLAVALQTLFSRSPDAKNLHHAA